MITHHTKDLTAPEWENAVHADLRSLGYDVVRLGDGVSQEIRQAIAGTTARTVRYSADFIAKLGDDLIYVDAKRTGDIHYWAEKRSAHMHLISREQHAHYLHISRYENIPFLYAFPCGRLCGYTGSGHDRFPHPGYMHVETFDRLIREHVDSDSATFSIYHYDDTCQPTPASAIQYRATAPARHQPYALETTT